MLFNSYEFLFGFLPVVFVVYFYLNRQRLTLASKGFLVFASLFFYSWWDIVYLPLILSSIFFNYACGAELSRAHAGRLGVSKKTILVFGITANLGLLGYFKYADFFIGNVNFAFGADVPLLHLTLPLAISFFTFQQITYLVDSYRGLTRDYGFLNYAAFVTFFPQLIAGPIVHHSEMMSQFSRVRAKVINYQNIFAGLFIFSIGLFKKVVIADTFSVWAINGYDVATSLDFLQAWGTSLSYTLQIYFDFSGYSDMAIGLALLFNIRLPQNFDSPYKSLSIQEFWRRWHITLSRFLREYVYVPFGGSRHGEMRAYASLLGTFILGGIWHGAGWTYIFWGFLHGFALVVQRIWTRAGLRLPKVIAWIVFFNFLNFTFVVFRAKDFDAAFKVMNGMLGMNGFGSLGALLDFGGDKISSLSIVFLFFAAAFILPRKNSNQLTAELKPGALIACAMACMITASVLSFNKISEFLYFNF